MTKSERVHVWHGVPIEALIGRLPLPDEDGVRLDRNGVYVDFIETFTVYYGCDESREFVRFLREKDFSAACFKRYHVGSHDLWIKAIRTLKHTFALKRMQVGLHGEDMVNFSGIPYLYEAMQDLDSALLLFQLRYPKECLQLLRSTLETTVIHAYLTVKRVDYDALSKADEQPPPVTEPRKGMLAFLCGADFMDRPFADEIRCIYRILSESVHSRFSVVNCRLEEEDERDLVGSCLNHIKTVSDMCTKLTLCILRYQCVYKC